MAVMGGTGVLAERTALVTGAA
ncbi:MAG: hypothetical protein QOK46_378, partial [Microbacteriaceae bacterium]|nr:hypothetical protein [Microbacteriaceae bacterium]